MAEDTSGRIIDAAKACLLREGYAGLSTRRVATEADIPVSQIHYHFGSKQELILRLLRDENERLLKRQGEMFSRALPLWKRWEMACDFLEDDIESGYVRVLQEMIAAGWSNPEIAVEVRLVLDGWSSLLAPVVAEAEGRFGKLGPFNSEEIAALVAALFLGMEAITLLDYQAASSRTALRGLGRLIQGFEEGEGS